MRMNRNDVALVILLIDDAELREKFKTSIVDNSCKSSPIDDIINNFNGVIPGVTLRSADDPITPEVE